LGGLTTEGIFRKPGSSREVEKLKDRLQSTGQLEIQKGFDSDDPHVLGSLFKLWFRELQDPIIPYAMYNVCVENASDQQACVGIAQTIPIHNRNILCYVMKYLTRYIQPQYIAKTMMSVDNLAVVFAPNIIRNASNNPMVVMKNSPLEQLFVKQLLLHFVANPDFQFV